MGRVTHRSWYISISVYVSPIADNVLTEDEPESSSGEDTSVEIVSPPRHRPITRSVSAKRAADTMDNGDMSPPSSPRPTKVQRGIGKPGIFLDPCGWPVANLIIGLQKKVPLFTRSPSPEPTDVTSISSTSTVEKNLSSHLDKDYFESENPWTHPIMYF